MKKLLKKLLPIMRHSVFEIVLYTVMTFTLVQLIIINIMLKDWEDVFHFVTFLALFVMYMAVQIVLKRVIALSKAQQEYINELIQQNDVLKKQKDEK